MLHPKQQMTNDTADALAVNFLATFFLSTFSSCQETIMETQLLSTFQTHFLFPACTL